MSCPYSLSVTLKKHCLFLPVHSLSIENDHVFVWVAGIYPPCTFLRVWSSEIEMKRFPNFYKNFKGFSKNLCCTKRKLCIRKTWTKRWVKLCCSLQNFALVCLLCNAHRTSKCPLRNDNVITIWYFNAQSQNRNTRKMCDKCSKVTTKNTRATSTGIFIDIYDFKYVNAGWVRSSLDDNHTYSACWYVALP